MSFYYRLISVNDDPPALIMVGAFYSLWVVAFDSFTATSNWPGFCLSLTHAIRAIHNRTRDFHGDNCGYYICLFKVFGKQLTIKWAYYNAIAYVTIN